MTDIASSASSGRKIPARRVASRPQRKSFIAQNPSVLWFLLALSLFLGIYPKPVIDRVEPSVRRVICGVERGSDYQEPAVATRGTERRDCERLDRRELAGR